MRCKSLKIMLSMINTNAHSFSKHALITCFPNTPLLDAATQTHLACAETWISTTAFETALMAPVALTSPALSSALKASTVAPPLQRIPPIPLPSRPRPRARAPHLPRLPLLLPQPLSQTCLLADKLVSTTCWANMPTLDVVVQIHPACART